MMTDKDSSAADTDNRPPMLEENDYESWRICIERYIKGKPHGKLIWKSIQNGPTPHPQTTDPAPEGGAVPSPRNKRDEEFTEEDNRNELADIQAINILSQGLPRRSGQTLERRKEALFDEFERFRANGNELIQDYFVRFHKLVNDMKVTQLDIPTHQLNTKFANNLPSYWGKYVTHAKNNMNMSIVTYVELFTHLRTYEEHALKSLKKKKQSSTVVDPLTYLAKTTPTHSTTSPVTVPTPQLSGDSHNDAMLATMNQIANLLSGLQKQFLPTNNQLRTSSNPKTHATVHDGQIVNVDAEAFLADVECTAPYDQPLALMTTNLFEANHEDAYDSDVDEGPHASAAFMANLSSTGGKNALSSSHINEVQISDDLFFIDVSYPLAQEMQQEEHLNSEVDSVLDDNMITYDEYQNDSRVEAVPTVVSADEADKQSMIAVLQRMHTKIAGYVRVNDEHKLVNETLTAKLERCKIKMQALECNKVKHDLDMAIVERNKQNAKLEEENVMLKSTLKSKVVSIENLQQESKQVLSKKKTLEDKYLEEIFVITNANKVATNFVPQMELSQEQVYWIPAVEIASQYSTPAKPERTAPPPSILSSHRLWHHTKECFDEQITPFFNNIKQLFQTFDTNIFQEVKEFERILDELDAEYERILFEKKNMQIEKKNLLITNECLIANSIANDICFIALAYDLVVPPSSDSSHCMLEELRTTYDREHSKLKEQLQRRNDPIRNLQAQNDIMSLLNVGSTDDSCNKQALEIELTQLKDTVTSLKIQNDVYKIAAQKAEIATLNAKTVGNKTSGTTKPANPKVIASGMYAISPKYIVPQRRTNRETVIPLPTKKQVTFQETHKPSPRFTKKPVAPLLKKPNVNVPLSTGIKSTTEASKPASKSNAWIYRKLPAKSAKGEKVEEHIRNLNKNNRVDSHVKRFVYVKT
nr:hypothetical protein [Tanacetum cinerariifolium]